jgi:hypothetical protein
VGSINARPARLACALAVVGGVAMALLLVAPAVGAYTFGEPGVRAIGPEVTLFDWTTQKCNNDDIPDQPTRAFRDVNGQVVVVNSHHTTRRWAGSSLAGVTHSCSIMMGSGKNADPSKYDDREWLGSTYTADGTTVYGLIHAEYQGYNQSPGYCVRPGELFVDKQKCWYNALTLTKSTNNGATFSHATPPAHYIGGPPYRYSAGIGPIGFFQPSNIVRGRDGYLYVLAHIEDYGVQPYGSCLMRTNRIDDPSSWRMWDGTGFNRRFRDPYLYDYPPAEGVCEPVSREHIGTLSESLTWSTYLKKWVLMGGADNADASSGPGFYYYTSNDLVNWEPARLVMTGELPWTHTCADGPEQIRDPSLLDNDSTSRNFDTIGQRPFLYFTRFNVGFNSPTSCYTSLDRDLIRIPLEFSNQQPGGPSAALAASTVSPRTGEMVSFDASGSRDADGSIVKYQWDLDGDGTYERDTGSSSVTRKAYDAPDTVTVTVRVSDDDGKATDDTTLVRVAEPGGRAPVLGRPGAAPAAIGRLSASRSVRGTARGAILRVRVPAAGTLRLRPAAGRRAVRRMRTATAERGIVSVRVIPSRAGRALLARHGRLRLRVVLSFTPVGGATQKFKTMVALS